MHSHFEGLVPVFSPDDINTFIKMLLNAFDNGIPLENVYITLVNPNGTVYQLWGTSDMDMSNLAVIDQNTIDKLLNKDYVGRKYELEKPNQAPEFYQTQFLKFMRDKMNISGAKFYSIDSSGNGKQVSLNGNNRITTNCP